MKKYSVLAFLLMGFNCFAQNSLLFEITGNGMSSPSYLFGTMHVQDEAAFGWNDSVFWAIDQVGTTAFEIDFDAKKLKKELKPSPVQMKSWENFIVNDLSPAIEKTIPADTLGMRIAGFYSTVLTALLEKDKKQRGTFVDMFLQEYAQKEGKEVVGVESIKEQLNIFLDMDKQLLKKSIIEFLENDNWDFDPSLLTGGQAELIEAYGSKRLTDVCAVMNKEVTKSSNELINQLYERIFNDRNEIMYKRASKMIKKKPHFIAVGAGHLCGSTGLIERLTAAGYQLRPIDITTTTTKNIAWRNHTTEIYSVQIPEGVSEIDPSEQSDFDPYSLYSNKKASIYTTKGKASFTVEYVVSASYDDSYDMMEYAEEMSEDYEYEDVDMDSPIEYVGDDGDDAEEEEEEMVEYEGDYDIEYESDEVVEYEEQPEVVEEVYIETDDDESFGDMETEDAYPDYETDDEYSGDYEKESKRHGKNSKKSNKPFESEYWTTVTRTVMSQAMGQLMSSAMKEALEEGGEDAIEEVIETITVMDKEMEIETSTNYLGYSKKVRIPFESGFYELTISGDPAILNSGELDTFFTSFQIQ